jgi:hypothetical protein
MGISLWFRSLALGLALASAASAAEPVGTVKVVRGAGEILRGGEVLSARVNLRLQEGDRLRTGPDGSLGVMLSDDSRLSLGPETELVVDRFLFAPAEGLFGKVLRLLRGTASYVSGKIDRLSPESVRFETPVGTVGVRGTRFLARAEGRP